MAALGLCCCTWAFSSHGEWRLLSSVAVHRFSLWWLLMLQSTGSRVRGLSCPMAGGIFPKIKLVSPALQGGFLTTGPSKNASHTATSWCLRFKISHLTNSASQFTDLNLHREMEDQIILWKNSNMDILSLCFLQKGHGHLLKESIENVQGLSGTDPEQLSLSRTLGGCYCSRLLIRSRRERFFVWNPPHI